MSDAPAPKLSAPPTFEEEKEARLLARVHQTTAKMLRRRKYIVPQPDFETWEDLVVFKRRGESIKTKLMLVAGRPDSTSGEGGTEKIVVFFVEEERLGVKEIRKYVNRMEKTSTMHAILVVDQEPNRVAKTVLATIKDMRFEVFRTSELVIDKMEHELVPRHEVLTAEEKQTVLKRYNLRDAQLPKMMSYDPVARYFGLQRGQVVKIIRSSETAGRYVTFRVVV